MKSWNDGLFSTLLCLHRANQLLMFYDGSQRNFLPAELKALDEEIHDFVLLAFKRQKLVYAPYSFLHPQISKGFEARTLKLARPLMEWRRGACEGFNQMNAIYTTFPPEMLAHIFEHAVEQVVVSSGVSGFPGILVPRRLGGTLALASVTRSWRSHVLANPNMWANFCLSPPSPEEDEENSDKLLIFKEFLERSKNVSLHLQINLDGAWGPLFSKMVNIVKGQAHRIHTLRLDASSTYCDDHLRAFDFVFPEVEVLALNGILVNPWLDTPNVSHLQLGVRGHGAFTKQIPYLTSLDLACVTWYQMRSILEVSISLKTLRVVLYTGSPFENMDLLIIDNEGVIRVVLAEGQVFIVQPLLHVALESLWISEAEALRTLTLPSLQNLYVEQPTDALTDFVHRSSCSLVQFGANHIESLGFVTGCASIKQLHIHGSWASDIPKFLENLTNHGTEEHGNLYPLIKKFESISIHADADGRWESLGREYSSMIRSVLQFHAGYSGRLKALHVFTGRPLTPSSFPINFSEEVEKMSSTRCPIFQYF